jgi:hypothetical protein
MFDAMDIFACHAGHAFLVCRADRPKAHYEIDLSTTRALDYVPHRRHDATLVPADAIAGVPARAKRGGLEYPIAPGHAAMFDLVNGNRNIRMILDAASASGFGARAAIEPHGLALFQLLWRLGIVAFRIPS